MGRAINEMASSAVAIDVGVGPTVATVARPQPTRSMAAATLRSLGSIRIQYIRGRREVPSQPGLGGGDDPQSGGGRYEIDGMHAGRRGEAQHEGAALADLAVFQSERAAVPLRQLAADEEAKPGTGLLTQPGVIDSEEAFKDLLVLVPRDSDPMVFDDQRRTALGRHRQVDTWAPGGVSQRVVNQVVDDARELLAVGVDGHRLIRLLVEHLGLEQSGSGLSPGDRLPGH